MLNEAVIKQELRENTNKLIEYIREVDNYVLLRRPSIYVWSIMDCYEHIEKLEKSLKKIFLGKTEITERNPTEKIEKIGNRFSDFEHKFTAGEPIQPKGEFQDKEQVMREIKNNREELLSLIHDGTWADLCLGYEHSLLGFLTKIEWLYFCIFHSDRHLHQMKEIEGRLVKIGN
ncbi:MAG: DinB family protein [Ignavibacteria bacterium]